MSNLKEQINKIEEKNRMFKSVKDGKEVVCPKCRKGHLRCKNEMYFYCDNDKCNVKIVMNFVQ